MRFVSKSVQHTFSKEPGSEKPDSQILKFVAWNVRVCGEKELARLGCENLWPKICERYAVNDKM